MSLFCCSKRKKEKSGTLELLLKIFLIVGIIAGVCFVLKSICERIRQHTALSAMNGYELEFGDTDIFDDEDGVEATDVVYDDEDDESVEGEAAE